MTILFRGRVSGQYVYWDGNASIPVGATDIIQVSNTETFKYPDIDANTIVAWNFGGTIASGIPNLGSIGSIADMTTIGANVKRFVPGPVSQGIAYNQIGATEVRTASGAVNLGSASFTSSITMLAIFKLYLDPTIGGTRRIFLKGYHSTWGTGGIYQGASIEFQGSQLTGIVQTLAGFRQTNADISTGRSFGLGYDGMHMAVVTYGTEGGNSVTRIYYDGVEIGNSGATFSPSNLNIGVGSPNEGPWNVGANYTSGGECFGGIMYHARAENVVRSAEWVRQAWINFNGW
jgi:hypothetical protein